MTNARATNNPIGDGSAREQIGAPNNECWVPKEPPFRSVTYLDPEALFPSDKPAKKPSRPRESNPPEKRAKPVKDPRPDPDERVVW